jgi:hypothetical protein
MKLAINDMIAERLIVGEPKTGNKRFWNTSEIRILKATYPVKGLEGCLPMLPGRTAGSIYQHAAAFQLVAPSQKIQKAGVPRQNWTTNPHMDQAIRNGYAKATKKRDVIELAKSMGRPRWWVSKRAMKLGCIAPRFKEPPWSAPELAIITDAAHLVPETLRRRLAKAGYTRTPVAILLKLKRLHADRQDPDHCTANALAGFMGVDPHTVTDWVAKGWLIARRRGNKQFKPHDQQRDHHWIAYADVRHFIIHHAAHIDIRKVDKFWFIDLLAGPYQ